MSVNFVMRYGWSKMGVPLNPFEPLLRMTLLSGNEGQGIQSSLMANKTYVRMLCHDTLR